MNAWLHDAAGPQGVKNRPVRDVFDGVVGTVGGPPALDSSCQGTFLSPLFLFALGVRLAGSVEEELRPPGPP